MTNIDDWNPEHYLKYRNERTQPSIDLVSRIQIDFTPENIIDIGCGPGNSSQVLIQRWPEAGLVGLDSSEAMIEKAKKDYPDQEWLLADAATFRSPVKYDILFSNATIQWIPDHKELLNRFYELLSSRGVMAVQIPLFWDMPIGKAIKKTASGSQWNSITREVEKLFTIHDRSFYYDVLSAFFNTLELWQTSYFHILDSHHSILDMIRSTGLKPYYERLEKREAIASFEKEVFQSIQQDYPVQKNGKVIFPFERLFFIGYK